MGHPLSDFSREQERFAHMPRKKGSTPAEFVTASQAIQWLAKPNRSAAKHETSWDSAQARVIRAHVNGRINLIGRKEDVTGLAGKPTPLERIPSKYFAHDVVLGDSLFARPHKKGPPVTRETWRDVKMARSEFEAEFKHTSAEAALLRWWKETTRREGRSPTERDAFLEFAQR